ncbi:hypothetical protein ALC57_18809, partial [Trachymyrmex cornetzi]
TLTSELFGEVQAPTPLLFWNSVVLNSIQSESRSGLPIDIRSTLLAKYEVKNDLQALIPPKLNKELLTALTPSVVKRDEYQALAQAQVRACLNTFGTCMSQLLKPEVLQSLNDEAKLTPSQLWFPLFRRLSLSEPMIFPPKYSLLSSPFRNQHPAWRTLSLGVAKLSGKSSKFA